MSARRYLRCLITAAIRSDDEDRPSYDEEDQSPDQAGHPAGHIRPRSAGLSRFRQSAGLSRVDPALSHRGRSGCPPRPLQLRAPRHAYLRSAGKCTARTRRRGLRRRGAAAVRTGGDLRPRSLPSPAPAITCWSPTASIGRPEISATACSSVWASKRPTTIPLIGADIAKLFRTNTRVVFVEAPGSQSFEMQDIPAIAKVAHDKGAIVMMDNTWATPLYFRAFEKGVDMQIQAGTKYIGGHSDIMFGCVSANAATLPALKDTVYSMGLCVGPDDMYLALRGLRTLGVRLARHYQSGLRVARWLEQRPEVLRVLHPALETRSGPRHLETGFHRRLRLVQHRAQADKRTIGARFPERARIVWSGLFLGWLRKPGHPVRLHRIPHRYQMGAGRPDDTFPYRTGRP